MQFPQASMAEAMARLVAFTPRMGRHYAAGRNHDLGPERRKDVSGLSPYIRRRLVLEQEAVVAAIAAHGLEGAEKFVQEVFWRGYFKGWLEQRPQVWRDYCAGLAYDLHALERDRRLRKAVLAAEQGQTGIACFDAWAQELAETGYLHNHARMWFASIWIFTLGLPWRLGADFFLRHLLDGDPASNTLGWRWVAGLHTRGKFYAADPDNIRKFTANRFAPRSGDLAHVTEGLEATEPEGLPPRRSLRKPLAPDPDRASVLLITEEDCRPEEFNLPGLDLRAAATLSASHLRSVQPVLPLVQHFEAEALADAAARSGLACSTLKATDARDLLAWVRRAGASQIVTAYVPTGPLRDFLDAAQPVLQAEGVVLAEVMRDWDRVIWPHASAGFFKVRKAIPALVQDLGLSA